MVSKVVSFCLVAFLVQSIAAWSCQRPIITSAQPSVSISVSEKNVPCNSRSSVTVTESIPSVRSSILVSESLPSVRSSTCSSIAISDNGGPLAVTSIGPITPTGIALATELGLGGELELSGALPYLTAVAFEGQFASAGAVPVSYGCGECVAITEEIGGNLASAPISIKSIHSGSGCGCGHKVY